MVPLGLRRLTWTTPSEGPSNNSKQSISQRRHDYHYVAKIRYRGDAVDWSAAAFYKSRATVRPATYTLVLTPLPRYSLLFLHSMSFLSLFRPRRTQSRITSEPPLIKKNSHIPYTSQTIHPSQSDSSWSSSIPRDIPPEEESRLTDSVLAKLEVRREGFKRAYFESCEDHAEARWPKLERYIATDMLPDILVLEQGSSISPLQHEGGSTHSPVDADPPLLYIRAHPHLGNRGMTWSFAEPRMHCKEGAEPRIAHLWWDLDDPDRMHGTHGYVRRAAFTRQETVSGGQLATVTEQVLAKHAGWSCEGHRMLQNEAMLYSMFPRELMDTASPGGHPPVVPKFYGFYVPVQGWVDSDDHAPCDRSRGESLTKLCRSNRGLLLMENCGDAQQRAEHLKGLTDKEKSVTSNSSP